MRNQRCIVAVLAVGLALSPSPRAIGQTIARSERRPETLPPGALGRLGTTWLRHGGAISELLLMPDGKTLASVDNDSGVLLSDFETGRELRFLPLGMTGPFSAKFAPDRKVVAATDGHRVRVLDCATGELRWQQTVGSGKWPWQAPICFGGDGRVLATAHDRGRYVHLWDTATGSALHRIDIALEPGPGRVERLVAAADGKRLAVVCRIAADSATVVVYALPSGRRLYGFNAASPELRFTTDGTLLVSAGAARSEVLLRDAGTGNELQTLAASGIVSSLAFSPDGTTVAIGGEGEVQLCDLRKRRVATTLRVEGTTAVRLGFSRDGRRLFAALNPRAGPPSVQTWELQDDAEAKESYSITPAGWNVNQVYLLSADGRSLATASYNVIRTWDLATGKERVAPAGAMSTVIDVAVDPDGKRAATTDADGMVRVWDVQTQSVLVRWKWPSGASSQFGFIAGSDRLAGVYLWRETVTMWDAASGKPLPIGPKPSLSLICGLAPDGTVAWRDQKSLFLVNLITRKELRIAVPDFKISQWSERGAVFAPDSRRLAVIDRSAEVGSISHKEPGDRWVSVPVERSRYDAPVVQWDLRTGKPMARLERVSNHLLVIVYAPAGRIVAGIGSHISTRIHLWEAATGKSCLQIEPVTASLTCLAFAPDGHSFATGTADGSVHVWASATGKRLTSLAGHRGNVWAVRYTPDGKRLLSTGADGTVLIWDASRFAAGEDRPAPSSKTLDRCWTALCGNAIAAHRAVWTLVAAPQQAVPFLRARLKVISSPDPDQVRRWIAALDHDDYEIRESAQYQLASFGKLIEPAVQHALSSAPSLEMRRRLQRLLASPPAPISIQTLRAIQVLELSGSAEARTLLQALAQGAAGGSPMAEAQESLERLAKRAAVAARH